MEPEWEDGTILLRCGDDYGQLLADAKQAEQKLREQDMLMVMMASLKAVGYPGQEDQDA